MQKVDFIILPELQAFIPPLTKEEYEKLELSILREGIRDPLVIWLNPNTGEKVLVDGHNRYTIAQRNGFNIQFQIKEIFVESIEQVKAWMVDNQLGKRNVTEETKSYLRGLQYANEKGSRGGDRKSEKSSFEVQHLKTNERLAQQHKVSPSKIMDDYNFSANLDKLCQDNHDLKWKILNREIQVSKQNLAKIVAVGEEKVQEFAEALNKTGSEKLALGQIFEHYAYTKPLANVKQTAVGKVDNDTGELIESQEEIAEILDILDDSHKAKVLAYIESLRQTAPPKDFEHMYQALQSALDINKLYIKEKNILKEENEQLKAKLEQLKTQPEPTEQKAKRNPLSVVDLNKLAKLNILVYRMTPYEDKQCIEIWDISGEWVTLNVFGSESQAKKHLKEIENSKSIQTKIILW